MGCRRRRLGEQIKEQGNGRCDEKQGGREAEDPRIARFRHDVNVDKQIPRAAAVRGRLAFSADAQLSSVLDARRDSKAKAALLANQSSPATPRTDVAAAVGAGFDLQQAANV